jgi:energy-converting hydrogenase Eha subunit F
MRYLAANRVSRNHGLHFVDEAVLYRRGLDGKKNSKKMKIRKVVFSYFVCFEEV